MSSKAIKIRYSDINELVLGYSILIVILTLLIVM